MKRLLGYIVIIIVGFSICWQGCEDKRKKTPVTGEEKPEDIDPFPPVPVPVPAPPPGPAPEPIPQQKTVVLEKVELTDESTGPMRTTVLYYNDAGQLKRIETSNTRGAEVTNEVTDIIYEHGTARLIHNSAGRDPILFTWMLDNKGRIVRANSNFLGELVGGVAHALGSAFSGGGGCAAITPEIPLHLLINYEGDGNAASSINFYLDIGLGRTEAEREFMRGLAVASISAAHNDRGYLTDFRLNTADIAELDDVEAVMEDGVERRDVVLGTRTFGSDGCIDDATTFEYEGSAEVVESRNEYECTFVEGRLATRKTYEVVIGDDGVATPVRHLTETINYSYDTETGRLSSARRESYRFGADDEPVLDAVTDEPVVDKVVTENYAYAEVPKAFQIFDLPLDQALKGGNGEAYNGTALMMPYMILGQ